MSLPSTTPTSPPPTTKPPLVRQNAFAISSTNWRKVRMGLYIFKGTSSSKNRCESQGYPLSSALRTPTLRSDEGVESKLETTVRRRRPAKKDRGKRVSGVLVDRAQGPILPGLLTPAKLVHSRELLKNIPRGYFVTPKVLPSILFYS